MGKFLSPLCIEQVSEATSFRRAEYRLTAALVYDSTSLQKLVIVPEGFITDFASVPRIPLAYLLAGGLGNKAACLHDFLYSGDHTPSNDSCNPVTRQQADCVIKGAIIDALPENKIITVSDALQRIYNIIVANVFYGFVRICGSGHWK